MANPLDTDAGTELLSSYIGELQLVQADLNQKLDQIPDLSGEPRKAALSSAERALEEAKELVSCAGVQVARASLLRTVESQAVTPSPPPPPPPTDT